MSPSYSDALAQARRLFAVLLVILADEDNSENSNAIKSVLLNEILNSKANSPRELGSIIRTILIMTINDVYKNNGMTLETIEIFVSEIKKRKTMQGILS